MSTLHTILSEERSCVAAATFILGDKWTPLIIQVLSEQPNRFCQLQLASGGINPRTLSARLSRLELEGIVEKRHCTDNSRTEYTLSQKGKDLLPIIHSMTEWGTRYTK